MDQRTPDEGLGGATEERVIVRRPVWARIAMYLALGILILLVVALAAMFPLAAFAQSSTIEVMIDHKKSPNGPASPGISAPYIARSQSQAPDIDSVVYLKGSKLHPGQFVNVKVTDFQAYDLVAEIRQQRSRQLNVLTAR